MNKSKIIWYGDVRASHSLSAMSRPIVAKLSEHFDVCIREFHNFAGCDIHDGYDEIINECLEKPAPKLTANDFEIVCKFPLPTLPPDHPGKIINWVPWEFDDLPIQWKKYFENYSTAVVGVCQYNEEIFREKLVKPFISHICPPVHPSFWDANSISTPITTILYDAGYSWRKGPDIMINLMKRFSGMKEVHFIWKGTKIYASQGLKDQLKSLNVNIEYTEENLSFKDLAALYSRSDIILYPTRAEGFGYAAAQALVMGKKIVAPNHTGMDYLNNNNSWIVDGKVIPVDPNMVLPQQYGYRFDKPIHVVEPILDHLHHQTIRAIAAKSSKWDRKRCHSYCHKYQPEFVANKWLELLERLS